ncbi:response regulator transcription factor [Streptomyces sp. HPF1205]|uniref:response regulator transcription factor n=1 Tax=Streptomyces sp. HPF1205 TaxID=2873262 RepID=UPI001CED0B3D|nr:response regulator transcription factor [Streptomyces sp. HPF1205]
MRILVVEDEIRLAELIVRYLGECGYTAQARHDGEAGLRAARDPRLDAAVVDVMLPGMDGTELCARLRQEGNDLPLLLLTARGTVPERIAGLDAGADDYLVKPFAMDELHARLRAVTRRRPPATGLLAVQDLVLDLERHRAWRAGAELDLSRREFAILRVLMEEPGRVIGRARLLQEVWDGEPDIRSNAIDVHISRLRAKVDRPFGRASISTLRGVGYRLETSA